VDGLGSEDILLFGNFRLDRGSGVLYRVGQAAPIALGARTLDLLGLLASRQGQVLAKDEILGVVWPGRVVEESNLNVQIAKLRHILDRDREEGSCIQTLPGRGYCFVAPVTRPDGDVQSETLAIPQTGAQPRPRLSIVVLPFANLSEDRGQQFFADGITDDLTTDLSRITEMFVISRQTAFTYRDKPVDTRQIGREMGMRFALGGSFRTRPRPIGSATAPAARSSRRPGRVPRRSTARKCVQRSPRLSLGIAQLISPWALAGLLRGHHPAAEPNYASPRPERRACTNCGGARLGWRRFEFRGHRPGLTRGSPGGQQRAALPPPIPTAAVCGSLRARDRVLRGSQAYRDRG
jgi:DNA-binding winged helix-turn-helix (wHTH) protein